jgi:uncharacterized protein (TIGR02246 family)
METAVGNTRELIQSLIEAFDNNDVEAILRHFTEDIEWTIVGNDTLSGKKGIEDFFNAHPQMKMLSSTKDHFVIDGDTVVVNGEVDCENESTGARHDMFYCDIYELEEGKVRKMTSYCIDKKKAEEK